MIGNITRNLARGVEPMRFVQSFSSYKPSADEVNALIDAAQNHPLGLPYLQDGYLDSVAATFEVHAFAVNEAREKLASRS